LLRGPRLISRWRFNRHTKGNGLRFRITNQRNLFEWVLGEKAKDLAIKRDREAHHIQIAGDTGSGKSTLVRQVVYQIAARNEVAIIFDPDREYIREFFREDRGDWVLNPKDDRCPYWPIGEECDDEAEATPIAIGLFPDEPTRQQFFLSHTRAIFSYLLATYKPTVNELAYWMAHPEEIDKRVVGTEHQHTLTANAAPQRAGILGSLNEAGKPLRMMPTHAEGRRCWSVREWSKKRKGWIFITSTPDTIDALRPLQSLWLDMLILKLQTSAPQPGQARVWMVLDELASLNALPQLHSALTKQRKSDNPIVLGFQGMSQLDAIYGKKAETILSQAYTNIILRTREPRAAKHLSELIGKAQLERMRESKPSRLFDRKHGSFSTERVIDPVVLESQIQGLEDLTGYFVQQDKIVAIKFGPKPKQIIAPDLIERIIPPTQARQLQPEPVPTATPANQQQSLTVDMLG
jgi:type IV secretory pathway TraG/TraD family ATPase VirD4